MSIVRASWVIFCNDVRSEFRTGDVLISTLFFGLLAIIMTSLSFYVDSEHARQTAPGVLWIATAFAGVLAVNRSWVREYEMDALSGLVLLPVPRAAIYIGKVCGTLFYLTLCEAVFVPVTAILFGVNFLPIITELLCIIALGLIGFVAAGTLFSAVAFRTRNRDVMLSLVLFPLVSPALLAGVVATRDLLGGATLAEVSRWMRLLASFDLIFVTLGTLLFRFVLRNQK